MFLINSQVSPVVGGHGYFCTDNKRAFTKVRCAQSFLQKKRKAHRFLPVWLLSNDKGVPSSSNGVKDLSNQSDVPGKNPTLLDSAAENSWHEETAFKSLSTRYEGKNQDTEEDEEQEPTSMGQFLGELWEELKQVEWPTLKQALQELVVLAVGISVVGGFIYLIDALFSYVAAMLYVN